MNRVVNESENTAARNLMLSESRIWLEIDMHALMYACYGFQKCRLRMEIKWNVKETTKSALLTFSECFLHKSLSTSDAKINKSTFGSAGNSTCPIWFPILRKCRLPDEDDWHTAGCKRLAFNKILCRQTTIYIMKPKVSAWLNSHT